jgi:hypothetical protein
MSTEENKALTRKFFDRLNEKDVAIIDESARASPQPVNHRPGRPPGLWFALGHVPGFCSTLALFPAHHITAAVLSTRATRRPRRSISRKS